MIKIKAVKIMIFVFGVGVCEDDWRMQSKQNWNALYV